MGRSSWLDPLGRGGLPRPPVLTSEPATEGLGLEKPRMFSSLAPGRGPVPTVGR